MPGPREVKLIKNNPRGGAAPEVKIVRVLGNQRLTPGGKIKRAKPGRIRSKKGLQGLKSSALSALAPGGHGGRSARVALRRSSAARPHRAAAHVLHPIYSAYSWCPL